MSPYNLLKKLESLERLIGHSPLHKLTDTQCNLYAKLEFNNFSGSIKDRPAYVIVKNALAQGILNQHSTIIESTSGNFGLSLAGICRVLGLGFIAVIDENVCREKERMLSLMASRVVKITERDETGGYLLNRINCVRSLLGTIPNAYNPNQYTNEGNYLSYYHGLANELKEDLGRIDYIFISVSSGGTITGLSLRLKELFPAVKVVAVDVEGSCLFSSKRKNRHIPGIGSSIRPETLGKACIDEVMVLSEREIVEGCWELLNKETVFAGCSSGAAYVAATKFIAAGKIPRSANVVIICPDRGNGYLDNIYDQNWISRFILQKEQVAVF